MIAVALLLALVTGYSFGRFVSEFRKEHREQ